jgi:hypothetical protein
MRTIGISGQVLDIHPAAPDDSSVIEEKETALLKSASNVSTDYSVAIGSEIPYVARVFAEFRLDAWL